MAMIRSSLGALLAAAAFAAGVVAQDDDTVDRLLASQCAQCHGTDGRAVGDMDSLAGGELVDLYNKLLDMKGEDRPEDIMDHQALGYTDEQLYRIARYFASLPE